MRSSLLPCPPLPAAVASFGLASRRNGLARARRSGGGTVAAVALARPGHSISGVCNTPTKPTDPSAPAPLLPSGPSSDPLLTVPHTAAKLHLVESHEGRFWRPSADVAVVVTRPGVRSSPCSAAGRPARRLDIGLHDDEDDVEE